MSSAYSTTANSLYTSPASISSIFSIGNLMFSPQAAYAKTIKVQRELQLFNQQKQKTLKTPIIQSTETKDFHSLREMRSTENESQSTLVRAVRVAIQACWLHSSSLLRKRLSRHLHLQKQLHPHSQHQYISAANQEIKVRDKFFRTSDLQQQSMMMGCCLSPEAVLFLHLFFSVKVDYNHSFRLDWLHSSSLLRRRLSRHLHLQQQLHPHSQHQYFLQQIKRSRQGTSSLELQIYSSKA
nr:hypothetical protein Iba_chr14aCG27700 [Ipomoea batatas]